VKTLLRLPLALAGGALGAALVAAVEARAVAGGAPHTALTAVFAGALGVVYPIAVLVVMAGVAFWATVEPGVPKTPWEHLRALRTLPVLARSRVAAVVPLGVFATFAWVVLASNLARRALAEGEPREVGLTLAVGALALLLVLAAAVLAALAPTRRLLAALAERSSWVIDPALTGGAALLVASALFGVGVALGDTGGDGFGALGIFGVLKRRELDLRPLANVIVIALAGYLFAVGASRARGAVVVALAAALAGVAPAAATAHAASALTAQPELARAIERVAPLGKIGLALARRATDRDHDGYSAAFGGGDCNDADPKVSPGAFDVPGNGVDEDCSGADTPPPPPPVKTAAAPKRIDRRLNVLLVTIDTLRADVGFLGYPKPVTPNLDKLAARGTVFENAYSLASYTGKCIGPMLIGRYPSETYRDGSHFNSYDPKNVFVTERLHDAGVRTFGAAAHWYFRPWSGVTQGMDQWDLSALPPTMTDNDNTVTSAQISDAALKLVADPANTDKPFFMWVHYFDPHAQYVPHPEGPDFQGEARGGAAATRAAYDSEIWFTDKHVGRLLDAVAAAPWGKDTAIIVTADHGEAFGEHNMSWHGAEIWQPLVHVPLLVYVPGAPAGRVVQKRSHIDVAPTILELMQVARPEDSAEMQGVSLVRDVFASEASPPAERDVYIDMPAGPFNMTRRALVTGTSPGMKLIHLGGTQYQLFDLAKDPTEKEDLSSDKERLAPVLQAFQTARSRVQEIEVKPDAP